jgi:hypothetical protein
MRISRSARVGEPGVTATMARPADPVSTPEPARPRRVWVSRIPWIVLALCLALFIYGEQTIPEAVASQFGLLAVASPAYGISILLAAVGFAAALRQSNMRAAVVATVLMVVVQRLPRTIATEMPMYGWTYKHLAVVDYIQHSHSLAREVDIYNCWSGLFGLTAWFSDLTGLSEMSIAHWWTPCFHLALTAMVYGAARAWGFKPLTAITATFLVATLNWVEQDYYSPQSVAVLLAVAIIAVAGLSRERAVGSLLIIALFAAMTITHQLTPYWTLLALGLLVVGRKMKPWWILFPLAAIALGFLLLNWDQAAHFTLFSGDPIKNAQTNVPVKGVLGQQITSVGVRVLAASMWVATALTLFYRWRKKQPFWAMGVLALSPILILGGQNYGGEAIFRVYLYSLTGCAMVLAPVLVALLHGRLVRWILGYTVVIVATTLSAQGYTGSWYANVIPKEQYDISRAVVSQAELPAYITSVAPVWPERVSWRYIDYARFNRDYDVTMTSSAELGRRHFDNDLDYQEFIRQLYARADASTYLIFSEQMRVYAWYFGILPWDALPNLKARMFQDTANWQPIYDGQGITVFVHKVSPYGS